MTKIRRIAAILLTLCLCVGLAACGSSANKQEVAPSEATQSPSAEPDPSVESEAIAQTSQTEPETQPSSETIAETDAEAPDASASEPHADVLVVVFSATGTTKGVAEKIARVTGADLVEIQPSQPYTAEDLNYNDRSTRATVEQNTPDARPEIANDISLEGYSVVYLGYPIWWGQAPRIMSTFVESHDFTGITVIPFCTSGGSGAGRTGETLGEQAGTGTFLTSTRFNANVSEADLQAWVEKMN